MRTNTPCQLQSKQINKNFDNFLYIENTTRKAAPVDD